MKIVINAFKHFTVVMHHKFVVLKLSIKAGIPLRGLLHDLSKFSPVEFINGAKYYAQGKKSPIQIEKMTKGYSDAWLHHKGRNKHHPEYWYDINSPQSLPIIPFKYMCEMVCDQLSAGIVYKGKEWTKEYQLSYWTNQKENFLLNKDLKDFLTEIYEQVAQYGIDQVITKKNLEECYKKHALLKYNNKINRK